jgi:tripartite-type tricarboxylate transporter receptor subunit TctC
MRTLRCFIVSSLVALTSSQVCAQADQKLTIVVGYPPGANYDLHARVLARYIPRHLSSSPTVIVQNMPGAGSLKVANFIYNFAPKDGFTIGVFARGMASQPLLDPNGVAFDSRKFNWIGSPSSEASVVFASASRPFKTLQDAQQNEMILAATGSGSDSLIFPYILNGVLGTKFKVVTGYPGSADLLLAVERGEADGNAGTSWGNLISNRPDWIRDKKVNLMAQLGTRRHPDLPDVPFIMDFATNDSDRKIFELIFSRQTAAYPFAAPPNAPEGRIKALRDAFDATMKDAEYLADAKRSNLEIDPTSGVEIDAIVASILSTPPDIVARAKQVLKDGDAASARR